jgi:3-isopropylmalate/(R)-2-methylmalate dehydratase small subunit
MLMESFTVLNGIAAPLNMDNIDTDKILPGTFLKTIQRTGLGVHLFETLRYESDGREKPDFVLNKDPYRHARFLIAGANFGCGSSREHAPWALFDFGIRCVIAPSFADIFHANCFKTGLLPVSLPREICNRLMQHAASDPEATLSADLARQTIKSSNGLQIPFQVDPFRKRCLLNGFDEIDLTLQHARDIETYEARIHHEQPWRPHINGI